MPITIELIPLGCDKNRVDAEQLLGTLLQDSRFALASEEESADVLIVNTCSFIDSAKEESISAILDCCARKQEGDCKAVVVTGCLAQRYQTELAAEIPEADVVLGIGSNQKIRDAILQAMQGKKVAQFDKKKNLPLCGPRVLLSPPHYAYLKIAEGCDNRCTYCAIPSIRGPYRSRPIKEIYGEASWLASEGVRELIVVAQDTTRYGTDLDGAPRLPELLEQLSQLPFSWIRLLYCYPEQITDKLLETMATHPNILPYLDIPIQHINTDVLKRMNRHTNREEILAIVEKIRKRIPNVTLRTTLIAGFPGETQEQFTELMAFVKEAKFDRLGCFPYSQEEGTPAAKLSQVDPSVRVRRAELIMLEQQRVLEEKAAQQIGSKVRVMVDEPLSPEQYLGRTAADAPEIDCNVIFWSATPLTPGQFVDVKIQQDQNGDLLGKCQ